MNLLLIFLIVGLVLLVSAFIIIRTDRDTSRRLASAFSVEAVHKFNTYLVRDLALVQKAASSTALVNWFSDEGDNKKWEIAYEEIMDYIRTFSYMRIYFGFLNSESSSLDYDERVPSEFRPFYRLYLNIPDHAGFFDCINTNKGYTFSIDINNFSKTWQLWVNHKVMVDGQAAGIICSCSPVNDLLNNIFLNRSDSSFMGYIIDKNCDVLMDTAFIDIYGNKVIDDIHGADKDPALISVVGAFPTDNDSCFLADIPTEIVSLKTGNYKYAAVTPIADTQWSVAVFYNNKFWPSLTDVIELLPVFVGMLLILILYAVGRNTLYNKLIFTPLSSLTKSVSDYQSKKTGLYGMDRDDEIGVLARTVSDMGDSLNAQAVEIRKANDQTQKLFNAMPVSCMLWNRDGNIFDCNEESLRVFKLESKQEFLEHFYNYSPEYQPSGENSRELSQTLIKQTFEEGYCNFKWTHQLLDGTVIPAEVILIRIYIGETPIIAAYVRDLRDYELMINEIVSQDHLLNTINNIASILLQSEPDQFEKNLLGCMGMMAMVTGVDRVYLWKNFTFEGKLYCSPLYEWPETPDVSKSGFLKKTSPYSDFPGWEEKLGKKQSVNVIISNLPPEDRKNFESQGILSILILPIFLDDKFWGFVGFDELHHERLFTENEESILRSGNLLIATSMQRNEMTKNLRYASVQLESALEKASKASRAKSDFLANMSHEMRTPLNAVIGLTQLTLETEIISSDARINLEKIYNAGSTLLSTVNDILDISKIEAGKLELLIAEYGLSSLINDVITQSNIYIGEKPIKFELDIVNDLPARLIGDELRIKQILNNLLSNACKYTMEGTVGLKIRCSRETPAALLKEIMSGSQLPPPVGTVWMTASVMDTGIGIRAEKLKNLFTDYTRMDMESNRNIEGTGLGLSIVKREVEIMGGSVSVESEYGKGSVFTVIIQQKHVNDETIGADVVNNLKNFRYSASKNDWNFRQARIDLSYAQVLVVDDNMANLDVAKGILNLYGIKSDCVTSGQEAVDMIRKASVKYNAIFMDHMMPGMDGIEAVRIIRNEIDTDYAKNIPIIALTANAIVGNEDLFLSNGFQAFISKPIEIDRLDVVVRKWVRDKELEKLLAGRRQDGSGQFRPDMRRKKDRRAVTERRSGVDRRTFGKVIAGVDWDKGLARFDNHEEVYMDVLRSFAYNTKPLLDEIGKPQQQTLPDYAVIVHGIKGSSRGIYATILGAKAEALEKAAREGDLAFVLSNNNVFIEETRLLINNINAVVEKFFAEHKQEKDKPDMELLQQLREACDNYDIDMIDQTMEKLEQFHYSGDDGLEEWLRGNIEQMNYKQISEKLAKLIQ